MPRPGAQPAGDRATGAHGRIDAIGRIGRFGGDDQNAAVMTGQTMTTIETTTALAPERFGFRRHGAGWLRHGANGASVAFASLAWPQAQAPSFDRDERGEPVPTDALNLIVRLQGET